MSETSLYPAVTRFLEAASFDVKGEAIRSRRAAHLYEFNAVRQTRRGPASR